MRIAGMLMIVAGGLMFLGVVVPADGLLVAIPLLVLLAGAVLFLVAQDRHRKRALALRKYEEPFE